MILNNYYNYIKALLGNTIISNCSNIIRMNGEAFSETSNSYIVMNGSSSSGSSSSSSSSSGSSSGSSSSSSNNTYFSVFSMSFGNGTTAPAGDDWELANELTIDEDYRFDSCDIVVNDNCDTTLTGTITNITDEDLVVTEIGISLRTTRDYMKFLCTRTVFEPVTIAPQESWTFTDTIKLEF